MSNYTPTTVDARNAYIEHALEYAKAPREEIGAEFDAWLTEHDRDIQARVLNEHLDKYQATRNGLGHSHAAFGVLQGMADEVARLTARDHCDGGCVNPGSGDCPTCKAAATEELTDG